MPSTIGYMAQKVDREIHHTKTKIRLQTGLSDEIVDLLAMPDKQLAELEPHQVRSAFKVVWDRTTQDTDRGNSRRAVRFEDVFTNDVNLVEFRKEVLFIRIQEFFSDFVVNEIKDTTSGIEWSGNRTKLLGGLRLYMAHHFTEKYSNNVTGLAYFGAAILIVIIGIRGLKFIPATKPSLILAAISLEGSLLALLAFGLIYTGEEERVDKLMKKMEDAAKLQLETMKDVSQDMHQMAGALVGETSEIIKKKVEMAIAEALASDDNVKRVVSDKVAEKIIVAMRDAFPSNKSNG
jgi:polyhydroxyalkanoate synthesis regulator phasin